MSLHEKWFHCYLPAKHVTPADRDAANDLEINLLFEPLHDSGRSSSAFEVHSGMCDSAVLTDPWEPSFSFRWDNNSSRISNELQCVDFPDPSFSELGSAMCPFASSPDLDESTEYADSESDCKSYTSNCDDSASSTPSTPTDEEKPRVVPAKKKPTRLNRLLYLSSRIRKSLDPQTRRIGKKSRSSKFGSLTFTQSGLDVSFDREAKLDARSGSLLSEDKNWCFISESIM